MNKLYEEAFIRDIADAIREKTGTAQTYTVSEMGDAVRAVTASSEPLVTFSQMNSIVAQYMAEVTYSPDDYSASRVLPYIYTETDYEKGHPTGFNVNIAESGELHLADDTSVCKMPSVAGVNMMFNAVPDAVTHWWNTVDGNVTANGTIKPTGQVRMIHTTANNVRDLGGWACDGGTIKYGKLFRGGLLSDSDRAVLVDQCKVRHDLDLRGKSDNEGLTASPLGVDVAYACTDQYVWYSLQREDEWRTILDTIFDAAQKNETLIFHCAAGADRTGTVACIVEAILGVGQADIDKDFELTSFAIAPNARRRTDANWIGLIDEINAISVGATFRDKVINWVGYLGFTADDINTFRHAMIDGTPETVTVEEYTPQPDQPDVPVTPDEPEQTLVNLAEPNADNTTDQSIWCTGVYINSSGAVAAKSGYTVTNYFDVANGDVIRVKGFKLSRVAFYDATNTLIPQGVSTLSGLATNKFIKSDYSQTDEEATFTLNDKNVVCLRLSGEVTSTADAVIITKNQPIV